MSQKFEPLTPRENELGKIVIDIAFTLHKALGPGLLESVYEKCFCYELGSRGIWFERQKPTPIVYNGLELDDGLKLDLLVDDLLIVELKAQENHHPVWEAQLLSYLKLTNKRIAI